MQDVDADSGEDNCSEQKIRVKVEANAGIKEFAFVVSFEASVSTTAITG